MALPTAGVQLVAQNISDFLGDMRRAGRAVEDFTDGIGRSFKPIGALGEMATGAFRRIGEIGVDALGDVARAGADFVKDSLQSAGDVEQNLNVLKVVGEATDAQMAQISKRAIELGADLTLPATSAQDATRAMLELAKSGLSVDDTMKAARGTLQLAAAGQLDAARAAEITSNALNAFKLSGDKATMVADLLAAAAAKSSVEVVDVADSFKMASSVFSAFQGPVVGAEQSMQQLTAAIAILGNAGIKGSDAGTSLKQMMLQLAGPTQIAKDKMRGLYLAAMGTVDAMDAQALAFGNSTERAEALRGMIESTNGAFEGQGDIAYNAAGQMRSMGEIVELVAKATRNMSDEQRNSYLTAIFGADATRAIISLMQAGPGALEGMTQAVTKQGAASELAGAQMQGWNGVVQGFQSQMETLSLIIGQHLLPILTPLGQKLAEAVGMLTQGDYTGFFTKIDQVLREALAHITRFFQEVGAGTSVISPFLNSLAAAFGPLGGMLVEQAKQWLGMLVDWIKKEAPPFLAPIGQMLVDQASKWLDELLVWIERELPKLQEKLKIWGEEFIKWIEPMIDPMLEKLQPIIDKLSAWLESQIPVIQKKLEEWGALFGEWLIKDAAPKLLQGAWDMWIQFLTWLADRSDDLYKASQQWAMALLLGIGRAILDLPMTLADLATRLVGGIRDLGGHLLHEGGELGRRIIEGFGRAIQDGVGWIGDQARNMAQAAINEARRILGIGSPSKLFAEIGTYTAQGMAIGLQKGTPMVQASMATMASPVAYPGAGGGSNTTVTNTLNFQPSYGAAVAPSVQRDSAVARSMAIW